MGTIIVGGGASGLMTALVALGKNPNADIKIIERLNRVGKKLLATGNGCCNFTNMNLSIKNYYSENLAMVERLIKEFSAKDAVAFFRTLGIMSKTEPDGKTYPYSYQASAFLDCMRNGLENHVEIITDMEIISIVKRKGVFRLASNTGRDFYAENVVIACGGASSKNLGSNGGGFTLLKSLGHSMMPISPALVQLKTEAGAVKGLQGIKVEGMLLVVDTQKTLFSMRGDLLFTEYGISGPPVLQASALLHTHGKLTAILDFMPEIAMDELCIILKERKSILGALTMENYLTGMINRKLGHALLKLSGIEKLSLSVNALPDKLIINIAKNIKNMKLNIIGTKGFDSSQVTAGGIRLSEFTSSLESKIVPGIYAVGEVLDVFGDCGGYNLHFAWASAYAAGRSIL